MKAAMKNFLYRLIPTLEDHLPDEHLASLFCDELPVFQGIVARWHLMTCRRCRLRKHDLENVRADRVLALYRDVYGCDDHPPLFDHTRASFAARLRNELQPMHVRPTRRRGFPENMIHGYARINHAYIVVLLVGFLTAVSLFMWRQQRSHYANFNAVLVRAKFCDAPQSDVVSGVIYQKVRITTSSHETVDRNLYRDLQGRRKLRYPSIDSKQQGLVSSLTDADVDWDKPISASDYQRWHDGLRARTDTIARAGSHLLKLTTSVPEGKVASQSLVVRDTDFHPVLRTVAFRHAETVEIAELDYKVLPWSRVDNSLFDAPNSGQTAFDISGHNLALRLPFTVSAEQLDEAELSARLELNRLHADTGEQIEIHRGVQFVEVTGVVETSDRKRQLLDSLKILPHVMVSLKSVTEFKRSSVTSGEASVQVESMPELRNPLAIYLEARGHNIGESNMLARNLFDAALTMSQESRAIADLQKRFSAKSMQSFFASATLAELMESHRERFESALRQERKLLNDLQAPSAGRDLLGVNLSLFDGSQKNLSLAKILTESSRGKEISAEKILAEMSGVVEDLREANRHTYTAQGHAPQGEKK